MSTIPGEFIQKKNGKCWSYQGRYLGEYDRILYGSVNLWSSKDGKHLPYEIYLFKNGTKQGTSVQGIELTFTEVSCQHN
jgi:hypothetical protein